ncbi:predicted protein [Lichtheimia corymbifera JMRC:FSU:9682]|uniref:Uncharacterized protein n=1 Tax=Lichtheimia corymbifera JMRC:FSU:9682 TaxID=1263082 RepID=A0A068RY96_9FUNG|nr:predicted protein [Lichtheimia corymbifera JMRC:FSU:9682]
MVNVWSDFTQQPMLAIESGTCANVITDSTRCLQQCVRDQMGHLDNRARALATSGNFEAALDDVAMIRQLAPSSAVGYLCAGHVYSLQGRQKAAIDIYEQGLAVVSSSDPSHQQLLEARSMAQYRDSKKIDFIKEFPIDIIENIAPWILSEEEITPSEIREYLDVSRVWRERLLLSTRELHIDSLYDDDLGDDDDLLEQVAPHCTALTIQCQYHEFVQLMSKAPFPMLQTLITSVPWQENDDDNTVERAIDTLASLGSTLTHLEVKTAYGYDICFGDILSSCPNLEYLKTWHVDTEMKNGPECHPNLKTLLFWMYDDGSDINDITKRLPGLEVFAANPIYDTRDLKILQDNCPNLKAIGCNDYDCSYFYVPTSSTSTTTRGHQHYIGVHTVYIDCYELNNFQVDIRDIVDFMKRNSHTLQHVYFYTLVGGSADDEAIFNHADDGALFNSMTTLINCIHDHDDILLTRWIARESPHLMEIGLSNHESYAPNAVDTSALFDDLIGRCELESAIVDLYGDPTMDTGSIERFIQYHGTFDSPLHTLTLPNHTRLSKDALEALTKLRGLENLSISWPCAQDEDQEDIKCTHLIGKLDQLQHLGIWSEDVVPDDVFIQLYKLNISSLYLNVPISKLSKPTVLLTLLQCPNLQELGISRSGRKDNPLIDEIRGMLKSQIEIVRWI